MDIRVKRTAILALLIALSLGSAMAQVDVSKLITGSQTNPERIAAIHFGPEGKLI